MAHWYVYRGTEAPLGPWTSEVVAEAILAGSLEPSAWVAAPGGSRWLPAAEVPVIAGLLEGHPTRRSSQGAVIARAPDTYRTPAPDGPPPGEAPVEIGVAPSPRLPATPYYVGGDTLESPGNERRRG